MSLRQPDLALRSLVAELAKFQADDVQEILAALSPAEQTRVEALLSGYSGRVIPVEPIDADIDAEWEIEGASPWLLARLSGKATHGKRAGKPSDFFIITPAAHAALRVAATPLRTPPLPADAPSGPSLTSRLRQFVMRDRS